MKLYHKYNKRSRKDEERSGELKFTCFTLLHQNTICLVEYTSNYLAIAPVEYGGVGLGG